MKSVIKVRYKGNVGAGSGAGAETFWKSEPERKQKVLALQHCLKVQSHFLLLKIIGIKAFRGKKVLCKNSPEFSLTSGSKRPCLTGIKQVVNGIKSCGKDAILSSKIAENHCETIMQKRDEMIPLDTAGLFLFPTRLLTSEDEYKWFWHQMIYFPGTII